MSRRFATNGIELAYDDLGDAGLPPMVLLHGLGERAAGWAPAARRLAASYHVLAVDLRGHGASDWPGEYSFELMYADVCDLLDGLGLGAVTLVGHSMGGAVACLVASRRPDLVERLVVEDACPPYPRERPVPERPDGIDFDWRAAEAIIPEVGAGSPEAWAGLARIGAPTLVVAGGDSSHVPQERLFEVARTIPSCELVTIPVGHDVHADAPGEFVDAVRTWLERQA